MKETHNSMDHLLSPVNYWKHKWLISGDLKIVGLVLGLQRGYPKYPYFLCLCRSQADDQHCVRQGWVLRQGLMVSLTLTLNQKNTASTLTYQVKSNEELCESNG